MKKHFLIIIIVLLVVGCKSNKTESGTNVEKLNILSAKNGYAFVDNKKEGYFIYKKQDNSNYEKVCKLPIRNNWLNDDPDLKFEYIYVDDKLFLHNNFNDSITRYNLNNCEKENIHSPQGYRNTMSTTTTTMIGADDKYLYYKKVKQEDSNWHFYKIDFNLERTEEINEKDIPSNLNKKM